MKSCDFDRDGNIICGSCGATTPKSNETPKCVACGVGFVFHMQLTPKGKRVLDYLNSIGHTEGPVDIPEWVLEEPLYQ